MMLEIRFGVLCDALENQLKEQGFTADKKLLDKWEKIRDSIHILKFHRYMTDAQTDKAFMKLHKDIAKNIKIVEE